MVGPGPVLEVTDKLDTLKTAAGRGKGHLLLEREWVVVTGAWPDGVGKGLLTPVLLPASHQNQPLVRRKRLPAGAQSCFPLVVCCFQFNIPGR